MDQVLDLCNFIGAIKICVGVFYFCYLNKAFKKLSKMFFTLPEKLLSSSTF